MEEDVEVKRDLAQPQRKSGFGSRALAGAIAIATILGGIVAVLQLRDYAVGKSTNEAAAAKPPPLADANGTRMVDAGFGAKVGVAEGWSVVSKDVVIATIPAVRPLVEGLSSDATVVFFQGPDEPGVLIRPFGYIASLTVEENLSLDESIERAKRRPNCLVASSFETPNGPILHLIEAGDVPDPNGRPIETRVEQFAHRDSTRIWIMSFAVAANDHFTYSESFQTMARSFAFPLK